MRWIGPFRDRVSFFLGPVRPHKLGVNDEKWEERREPSGIGLSIIQVEFDASISNISFLET